MRRAVLAIAGMCMATAAYAGMRTTNDTVYIDLTNRMAAGGLGAARNSADTRQYMDCFTFSKLASFDYGYCYATNAANVYASCVTSDAKLVSAIRSVNGDSSVEFHWDASGACTYLLIRNASYLAPKNP
jgi:hypothetical protein